MFIFTTACCCGYSLTVVFVFSIMWCVVKTELLVLQAAVMSPSVDPSMSLHPTAMITQQMGQLSLGNTGVVSESLSTHTVHWGVTSIFMLQNIVIVQHVIMWPFKKPRVSDTCKCYRYRTSWGGALAVCWSPAAGNRTLIMSLTLQYIAANPGVQGTYMPHYPPMQAPPVSIQSVSLVGWRRQLFLFSATVDELGSFTGRGRCVIVKERCCVCVSGKWHTTASGLLQQFISLQSTQQVNTVGTRPHLLKRGTWLFLHETR